MTAETERLAQKKVDGRRIAELLLGGHLLQRLGRGRIIQHPAHAPHGTDVDVVAPGVIDRHGSRPHAPARIAQLAGGHGLRRSA